MVSSAFYDNPDSGSMISFLGKTFYAVSQRVMKRKNFVVFILFLHLFVAVSAMESKQQQAVDDYVNSEIEKRQGKIKENQEQIDCVNQSIDQLRNTKDFEKEQNTCGYFVQLYAMTKWQTELEAEISHLKFEKFRRQKLESKQQQMTQEEIEQVDGKIKEKEAQIPCVRETIEQLKSKPEYQNVNKGAKDPLTCQVKAVTEWQKKLEAENEELKEQIAKLKQAGKVQDQQLIGVMAYCSVRGKNGSWETEARAYMEALATTTVKDICENMCPEDFCKYWASIVGFENQKYDDGDFNLETKLKDLKFEESGNYLNFFQNEDDYEKWIEQINDQKLEEAKQEEGQQVFQFHAFCSVDYKTEDKGLHMKDAKTTVKEVCEKTCGQPYCEYWVSNHGFQNQERGDFILETRMLEDLGWTEKASEYFANSLHFFQNRKDWTNWD